MKQTIKVNWLVSLLFFFGISISSFSQTLKDVFSNSESPLTYLGIDFSKSRLLDEGNPSEIRDKYYVSINDLIVYEPKKYDLKGAFNKSNIDHDFSAVTKNNAKANVNEILSSNPADFNRFKESDITSIVNNLDLSGKQGVGLLFVMEAMRKIKKNSGAAIWVTLVDMKTKKILMTERIESEVIGGIGFRNYWASAIKNLIDDIDKKKYNEWKQKYGS
jgi:hypothetical protein